MSETSVSTPEVNRWFDVPSTHHHRPIIPRCVSQDDGRGPLEIDAEAVRASNRTLLYCDFSTDHVCGLKVTHHNNSHLVSIISGSYLSFILSPGQEAMVNFPNSYKSKKGFCIEMIQRKGSNIDGDEVDNKLVMTLKIPSMNWFTGGGIKFELDRVVQVQYRCHLVTRDPDQNQVLRSQIRRSLTSSMRSKTIRIYEGKCLE